MKRDEGVKAGAGIQKPKKPAAPQYSSGLAPQQVDFLFGSDVKTCLENDGDESDLTNTLMKVRTQPTGGQMRAPPKEKKTKDDAYAVLRQHHL